MNIHDAKDIEGVLIKTITGEYVFRVYDDNHSFVDFDLHHCDLCVRIIDEDASFYQQEDGSFTLDHSPETLGIK